MNILSSCFKTSVSLSEVVNLSRRENNYAFSSGKALCLVAILKEHQSAGLLNSFIKPSNAVIKSTVPNCVKQILIIAGTNIDVFKPYFFG